MQRRQRDAGGVTLLEGGDARRIVAAEAVAHDGDALAVDLRALEQIVERSGARHLVVEAARHVAHAPHLAHAGPVNAKRVIAAAREFEAAEKDAHLLGVVHAVDHDHGRLGALAGRLH